MTGLYIFHTNFLSGSSLLWIGYYILYVTGSPAEIAEDNGVHCQIISKVR